MKIMPAFTYSHVVLKEENVNAVSTEKVYRDHIVLNIYFHSIQSAFS